MNKIIIFCLGLDLLAFIPISLVILDWILIYFYYFILYFFLIIIATDKIEYEKGVSV